MSTVKSVTAAQVRAWFAADEKRVARLPEAARTTVTPGARGRLHPRAVKEHNQRRRTSVYTLGNSKAEGEARSALRAKAAQAGVPVGKRGPLSKAALAAVK